MSADLPLSGVKVLEIGTVIAGPFAGSLLADLGAEVIKVEPPGAGDVLRKMGPRKNGMPLWWGVSSRGKRCITLNLKDPDGRDLFNRLASVADVLVENNRPGVLDRLGIGWKALHEVNPRLVMLSISGFGVSGPKAGKAGFGKIAEGLSGIVNLTGEADGNPLFVGFSLADTAAGLFGVLGVLLALYQRDANGAEGVQIDTPLYEPLLRMLDCQMAVHASRGAAPRRRGTNDPYGWGVVQLEAPHFQSVRAQTGEWFLVRIANLQVAEAVLGSAVVWDQLGPSLTEFAAQHSPDALRCRLHTAGADIVPILDGLSAAGNAYLRARGDVLSVEHPAVGHLAVPGFIAGASGDRVPFELPTLGQHTREVLQNELGLDVAEIAELERRKVV